ncbi:MAG TPA: sulfur carrier protein ThiS [Nitriliruptorales bacterium]|nr:sulfur carrier protein ThiS [Nitriliruptorales bacterium]
MIVTVNGEPRRPAPGTSVRDLVADLVGDPDRRGIAVALNGQVLRRPEWTARELADGDRLEILNAVQGG